MSVISGIQQIGIGCADVEEAWRWYYKFFGMDIPIFNDEGVAKLMLPYTSGKAEARRAVLAINIQGGGGFEIWQYTERTPQAPKNKILLGDTGIYAAKVKCKNAQKTFDFFVNNDADVLCESVIKAPHGEKYFWVRDPFGNCFQVIESTNFFTKNKALTGGVYGAIIGTTHIDRMTQFFQEALGYDNVVYNKTDIFQDFAPLEGGENVFARVLLRHSELNTGAFAPLLGVSEIELVQVFERTPNKIFANRQWGDLGFIHLCYDVKNMALTQSLCAKQGFEFTVDTANSFDMGEAAGRFAYIEDPDGTLIEFVETHKIPIMKNYGWYLDLQKRSPEKPLATFILRALALGRVKPKK